MAKQISKKKSLTLHGIQLFRKNVPVFEKLDLQILPDQHWVILGPNGSGKSTLAMALQGLIWPREGRIEVLGRYFGKDDLSSLRKKIGWVSGEMEQALPGNQTVLDITASGSVGSWGIQFDRPKPASKNKAEKLLNELGLGELKHRRFSEMSQGQRRLACIARALSTSPGLLILDEPCAGLDPVAREKFLHRIEDLSKIPQCPVLINITHHVEEIMPFYTHVLLITAKGEAISGPVPTTLTSKNLSKTFNAGLLLKKSGGRYSLHHQQI